MVTIAYVVGAAVLIVVSAFSGIWAVVFLLATNIPLPFVLLLLARIVDVVLRRARRPVAAAVVTAAGGVAVALAVSILGHAVILFVDTPDGGLWRAIEVSVSTSAARSSWLPFSLLLLVATAVGILVQRLRRRTVREDATASA